MAFTESVKSFHVPATPGTFACPPSRPSLPTSRAARVHRDLAGKISARNRRRHFSNVAHLTRQVAGHEIDVIRQVFPRAAHSRHLRLASQLAFRTHFARHTRYLSGERVQLVHHRVDRVL